MGEYDLKDQISLFDTAFPKANFCMKGKLLRIENGHRIISNDFYCTNCGSELFHNGEMMKKMKFCPYCSAELTASANFKREYLLYDD